MMSEFLVGNAEQEHWDGLADDEFHRNLWKAPYVVVVWSCGRAHGGPEEGGWSYEYGTRVLDADFHSEEAATAVAAALEIEYPRTGKRNSVLGGDDSSVRVYNRHTDADWEDVFDARLDVVDAYPVHHPRYE